MSDALPDAELMEMLLAALEATNASIATLSREVAANAAENEQNLSAIAQLAGLTYIAVAGAPPPADVLENPLMTRFLDSYPPDGPPLLPAKQWADTVGAMRHVSTSTEIQKERQYFERLEASSSALTRAISRQLLGQLDAQSGAPTREVPADHKDPPAPSGPTRSD